jgi:hypothetical protein
VDILAVIAEAIGGDGAISNERVCSGLGQNRAFVCTVAYVREGRVLSIDTMNMCLMSMCIELSARFVYITVLCCHQFVTYTVV